uniref:Glycosyltransferase family 4 protein n=1 Tax=Roseihalotalea indica TaxID=2867963 RepID=A0AA49JK26_9BACT|nr:glycosyltransferase family 4 protein [Tunicatimonas sp. TK19036]
MNILLSAYHCAPIGSESSVGWNYAIELAKLGHKVTVITSHSREPFVQKTSEHTDLGVDIIFYGLPGFLKHLYKPASMSEHIYYFFWQIGLFFFAKNIVKEKNIEVIHHITLGVFRIPSFLCLYHQPFIFGPVGGGENYPFSVKKSLPTRFLRVELLRDAVNFISSLNPLLQMTYAKSTVILCRTKDTLRYIPKRYHWKCKNEMGIGFDNQPVIDEVEDHQKGNFRLLYAGRPLYWKGIHLLIRGFAVLQQRRPDVSLTIVGRGDSGWAEEVAKKYEVHDVIHWGGSVSLEELHALYQSSDLFVFPSLREAGGMVAVESLCFGLPVLCLDIGGPGEIVDNNCGIKIKMTEGITEDRLAEEIADAIESLINNPQTQQAMSKQGRQRALSFSWKNIVSRTYSIVNSYLHKDEFCTK